MDVWVRIGPNDDHRVALLLPFCGDVKFSKNFAGNEESLARKMQLFHNGWTGKRAKFVKKGKGFLKC